MVVKEYENARTFLNDYEPILIENEAVSQLILYNAYQNLTVSENEKCIFGVVSEEEEAVILFCNVEPYNLVVFTTEHNINAITALADFLSSNHISITGINARQDVCLIFMEHYKKSVNSIFVEKFGMEIMEIREVNDIKPVEGTFRLAIAEEVKLITNWMIQFQIEALASEMDYEAALNKATLLIEEHKIYVYENIEQKVVSMAIASRKLIHGMALSYVFTPEEFRGNGYASANVFYISKEMLESGFEFCTLFADKQNPVLSRAYEKVGYKILEDHYEYKIVPPEI